MSLGKLNYDSLLEEFCVWYFRVNHKLPHKSTLYTKDKLVRFIWELKRSHSKLERKGTKDESIRIQET